jgi:L-asparaginase
VTRPHIRILATGGTIAGEADPACNGARYRAGVRPVAALLAAVPGLDGIASWMPNRSSPSTART